MESELKDEDGSSHTLSDKGSTCLLLDCFMWLVRDAVWLTGLRVSDVFSL